MRDHIIKQLREHSCVKGKQKTWVSALSDDQLYELFQRLKNEESAKSIAQYIQKAWGLNPNSTIHSISQGVLKFKKRIAHLLLPSPSANSRDSDHSHFDEYDSLESLEGMERVAKLQRERIERMMLEERELGIKHSNLSRDLQSLATLSKVIMKQKEFEIQHENNDPIKRRNMERKLRHQQKIFNKSVEQLDQSGDRDRLDEFTDRFFELLEKDVINLKENEDGTYSRCD